jgi:XTP/dITP diphosphohydrolase
MEYNIVNKEEKVQAFLQLLKIMNELRAECPWDKKQTWKSLSSLTIEELYELTDALNNTNPNEVKEELGDVLLHIVFYCKIAEEQYGFGFEDVCKTINEKLISRHPHIYGDTKVKDAEEVKRNWEKLKKKEGKSSVLSGVPKGLPAMIKAFRIQDKAAKVGFDWENISDVLLKVHEEIDELEIELKKPLVDKSLVEGEFGDLLFSLINYARFLDIDPEAALAKTNDKFIQRFRFIEDKAKSLNLNVENVDLQTMDSWWNEAKINGL